MSEIKTIEKLRDELKVCGCDPDECMTCSVPRKVKDGLAEIEYEIAERYMPLPCDADGVPVRVGDRLVRIAYDGIIYTVNELRFDGRSWWYESGDDCFACEGSRHKPRTLEDVLCDALADASCMGDGIKRHFEPDEPCVVALADEIRAMFGEFDDD